MSLDDLTEDVDREYADLKDVSVTLDEESRTELALLAAALDTDDPADLVARAVHICCSNPRSKPANWTSTSAVATTSPTTSISRA